IAVSDGLQEVARLRLRICEGTC
ncbi:hypothetical protein ETH_00043315, partial [Eimeria tenella]